MEILLESIKAHCIRTCMSTYGGEYVYESKLSSSLNYSLETFSATHYSNYILTKWNIIAEDKQHREYAQNCLMYLNFNLNLEPLRFVCIYFNSQITFRFEQIVE